MPQHSKTQILQGVLYIFGAIFLFAGSDALSKYLAGFYAVVMVIWIRYVVHSGLMLAVMLPHSGFTVFKTRQPGLQLLRGLCMVGTNMLFISALRYIPLAEGTAIVYLTPLIVTALSGSLLGERITRLQWFAVSLGFIGVLVILRPGGALFTPVSLLAVGAACTFSLYQLITRKLNTTDSSATTNLLSGLIGSTVLGCIAPFFWQSPSAYHSMLLLALGASALASHLLLTEAYHHANPSTLAPFTYAQLIFAGLIGYITFGNIPDIFGFIGIGIICASGMLVLWHQANPIRP
ncbi:EamA domain-containing membrane protein RarD [Methylobacillus rhizosphaerae]|uniref:EamA domain-containing membrane protein RarD n=1 Tax=Methylobacillus rhizosphaerae TaxID=551994 RepID=A0A238YTN6_9PROT|nr:DMT family transporter [Methylobacillus rhizosphaerae]SNR74302.1 EamA domain-containing membrane protein RarD [Methylobacillus rhizosphaerae]